jgi:hypothetical protein
VVGSNKARIGNWHEFLFVCDNQTSEGGESEFEELDRWAVKAGE